MWVKLFFLAIGLFFNQDTPTTDNSHPRPHPRPRPGPIPRPNPGPNPNPNVQPEPSSDSDHDFVPITDPLNVHLMVTSHMDAGWIYTFENYYQGTQTNDGGCVKCILDNVVEAFPLNSERKYDMAEVSFFNRWWNDQSPEKKAAFKEFVKNKQFTFVNGGWVTNDEATAYYDDIMENFILGHRWLKDNLDLDPNVGWHVDSFGNSAGHAGLMAQAGYDAMFFSRADYIDRERRKVEKSLQFNWQPPNPHNESVFTQMLYLGYSDNRFVLSDFDRCRTIFCKGNLTRNDYGKVEAFFKREAESFNTKNILFLVCDDFLFSSGAEIYYSGAEALMKYFNDKHPSKGIKVKYSHLSEYVNDVITDTLALKPPVTVPIKHDDTYPYVEMANNVWTGYFTSKPMYKMFVREFSAYYNAVKLLLTKIMLINDKDILDWTTDHSLVNQALNLLEEPLAIIQHHDSVTGTMKEAVRQDYEHMVNDARNSFEEILQPIMVQYLNTRINEILTPVNIIYDWLYQDDSYNNLFDTRSTPAFTVFNPGNTRDILIKLKVSKPIYNILNESNELVSIDVICNSQNSLEDCYIYFVDNFPAYSTKVYKIILSEDFTILNAESVIDQETNIYTSENISFNVSGNLLDFKYQYCLDQESCTKDSFNIDYYYYDTSAKAKGRGPSGAYIFTPSNQSKIPYSAVAMGRIFRGKYLSVLQIFRDNLRTDIKVLHHEPEKGFEVDTYLLPPKESGQEIVLVVKSNSINNGDTVLYTDSNGYFMQKRTKNHKDGFNIDVFDQISINYYPVTSNLYIEDLNTTQRLSVVTDRAQGAASLNTGEVEIMIHRVTFRDDNKGVGEPLQEKVPGTKDLIKVSTRHFISYSQPSLKIEDQRRQQQYDLDRSPQLWFYTSDSNKFGGDEDSKDAVLVLPELVKLYVRSYQPGEYIVRLHNLDENSSKRVRLYNNKTKNCVLLSRFAGIKEFEIESVSELSWMTTRKKSELKKNALDPDSPDPKLEHNKKYDMIDLVPMEIRTFSIKQKVELIENVPETTIEQ